MYTNTNADADTDTACTSRSLSHTHRHTYLQGAILRILTLSFFLSLTHTPAKGHHRSP